jgi:hypothetical protein
MLLKEDVAMTVETKTERLDPIATASWTPKTRRHGEHAGWGQPKQPPTQRDEEMAFTPTPPPVWPRIFPGI